MFEGTLRDSGLNLEELAVVIRGETRVPRYTEAFGLPEEIAEQAKTFGKGVLAQAREIKNLLADERFRLEMGLSDSVYNKRVVGFLESPNLIGYFGADGVVDGDGNVKFVEINSQPQVLGRFDYIQGVFGLGGDNSMAANVSWLVKQATDKGSIPVIVSHPGNAFYGHHVLFSEQTRIKLVSLQDLESGDDGVLYCKGEKVGSIVRMFSTNTLFDRGVVNEKVFDAVKRANVFNGLLFPFVGDKLFLKHLVDNDPSLAKYVPEMRVLSLGDELDLKKYEGWWLKADARKGLELTVNLNSDDMRGWTGKVLCAMVKGDFQQVDHLLDGKETQTAKRYRECVGGVRNEGVGRFLLQRHVNPQKIQVEIDGQIRKLNTLLRAYFVPNGLDSDDVHVYLELLAGQNLRVSLAGFGIPVK